MNQTVKILLVIGVVVLVTAVWMYAGAREGSAVSDKTGTDTGAGVVVNEMPMHEDIRISAPVAGAIITSPLTISGEARGTWLFEASAPVLLVDWDGRIIAEWYIETEENSDDPNVGAGWMTTDFVSVAGTLLFESPYKEGDPDFMRNGTLILRKDNPSGLPEHDDAIEIPIRF